MPIPMSLSPTGTDPGPGPAPIQMAPFSSRNFSTVYGALWLAASPEGLCVCDWDVPKRRAASTKRWTAHAERRRKEAFASGENTAALMARSEAHLDAAQAWLEAYSEGHREAYSGPLDPIGTAFQRAVWKALQHIRFGQTWSYAALARALDIPESVRAVASANGANLLSIVVPCHRVMGSDQSLTGYAGGLEAKRKLLAHEGLSVPGLQGDLFAL